jgi:hypothetical protein
VFYAVEFGVGVAVEAEVDQCAQVFFVEIDQFDFNVLSFSAY